MAEKIGAAYIEISAKIDTLSGQLKDVEMQVQAAALKMENSFNGKMAVDIEAKGKESKWITLHALGVLDAWNG